MHVWFTIVTSAAVYKTVDEHGNVVFTDEPLVEAEEVILKPTITLESPAPNDLHESSSSGDRAEKTKFKYRRLEITSPPNGEAVRANNGNFALQYAIEPSAQAGHIVQLLMDGDVYKTVVGSGTTRLENVDRGLHFFRLRVINRSNKTTLQTSPESSVSILR